MVFSLEMGKKFSLLYFCLEELERISWKCADMAEQVLRQTRTESQGRNREAAADISSKSALLQPPEKFVTCPGLPPSFPRIHLNCASSPLLAATISQSPRCATLWPQIWSPMKLLVRHSVLWPRLHVTDAHLAVQGDTQQSLVIDELVLLRNTPDEMQQERT